VKIKAHILVLLGYTTLTLILTWPLVLSICNKINNTHDSLFFLWSLWWVKKSVVELSSSPYYTHYVFHPTGYSLAYTTLTLSNTIPGIFLQYFFNIIATYNILLLFSYIVTGYGTYLLVHYITKNKIASFISGIIFAFSPIRSSETIVGHLNIVSTEWIPFYILFLIKTFREEKIKNPIIASLFLFLTSLVDWQHMGFMLIFTALFLFYYLWTERNSILSKRFLFRILLLAILFALFISPFIYPLLSNEYFSIGGKTAHYYSADLSTFLMPNPMHPILGKYSLGIVEFMKNNDKITGFASPIGYIVLALFIYYLTISPEGKWIYDKISATNLILNNKKSRVRLFLLIIFIVLVTFPVFKFDLFMYPLVIIYALFFAGLIYIIKEKQITFWTLSAVFFFLLSLGPILHILGYPSFALPYLFFMVLPGFDIFRTPYRFEILLMLSLAVISGYAMSDILNKIKRKKLFAIIISSLILFEFAIIPISLYTVPIPDIYKTISQEHGDFAILEIPISPRIYSDGKKIWTYDFPIYIYYQTYHNKKIVGGYVSNPPIDYLNGFIKKTVPFRGIYNFNNTPNNTNENITEILTYYSIRYVIVHKDILKNPAFPPDAYEIIYSILPDDIKNNTVYTDENLIVYKVK